MVSTGNVLTLASILFLVVIEISSRSYELDPAEITPLDSYKSVRQRRFPLTALGGFSITHSINILLLSLLFIVSFHTWFSTRSPIVFLFSIFSLIFMMVLPVFELKYYHEMIREGLFPTSLKINFTIPLPSISISLFTVGVGDIRLIDAAVFYLGMAGAIIGLNIIRTMVYFNVVANELSERR